MGRAKARRDASGWGGVKEPCIRGGKMAGHVVKYFTCKRRLFAPLLVAHPLFAEKKFKSISATDSGFIVVCDDGTTLGWETGEIAIHHGDATAPVPESVSSPDLLQRQEGDVGKYLPSLLIPTSNSVLIPSLYSMWSTRGGSLTANVRRIETQLASVSPLVSPVLVYRDAHLSRTQIKEAISGRLQPPPDVLVSSPPRVTSAGRDAFQEEEEAWVLGTLNDWRRVLKRSLRMPAMLGYSNINFNQNENGSELHRAVNLLPQPLPDSSLTASKDLPEVVKVRMAVDALAAANRRRRLHQAHDVKIGDLSQRLRTRSPPAVDSTNRVLTLNANANL
eukprot:GDKK01063089.1.p1 GENE.GDKK01063089.1~~GDKK01063089.1.p1  ORF type:complete len:334 (+),score=87.76 GDKK01063089.1:1-1002(+)